MRRWWQHSPLLHVVGWLHLHLHAYYRTHTQWPTSVPCPLTGPVPSQDKPSSVEDHPDDSLEEGEELGEGEEWEQVGWNNKSMVTRQVRREGRL